MITSILTILLLLAFLPFATFWSLWLVFTALALLPPRKIKNQKWGGAKIKNLPIDILIPAHNEQLLLPALLESLQTQSPAGKSRMATIFVVADHCTDNTAQIARLSGAEVLERTTGPCGKPAALRDGIAHLHSIFEFRNSDLNRHSSFVIRHSPHALLILDADCTCSPNLLEQFALHLDAGEKILQSAYLLTSSPNTQHPTPNTPSPITNYQLPITRFPSPSLLAFSLKNLIRPRGMSRLRIPTQLFGTGMCFHPDIIPTLNFSDHLTEDLTLSHQLLLNNTPPTFVPTATVFSPLPDNPSALTIQKLRWETGQFQTWKTLPILFIKLLLRGRNGGGRNLLALLDWSAPPLSLALLAWFLLTLLTITLAACHLVPPWILLAPSITLAILTLYILIGTLQLAPPSALVHLAFSLPKFLAWKLALYLRLLTGHVPTTWQKTPRPFQSAPYEAGDGIAGPLREAHP